MTDRSGVVCLYMICTPVDVIVFVFAYLCRSLKVTEAQTDPVLLKDLKGVRFLTRITQSRGLIHHMKGRVFAF